MMSPKIPIDGNRQSVTPGSRRGEQSA